ncbi:MAG: Cof-type HAD-IIB family hydrolase [Microbacteriaceae bacterium]|nr:Cof-type HAD-IIB family hydrolase [Microbacteriaceae bacterium]MCL2794975.1 Cof-type HAD-IIB family hydrolase [Microbacteriaceae bacterium]
MPRRRLLIGLDVDGTLIRHDESISDAVLAAVARVQALGHEVTLATGRSWETARPILERFSLSPEYVVCANGALTMARDLSEPEGYRREWVETFDATEVLEKIRDHLPRGSYMVEDAMGFRRYTEGMTDWELSNAERVDFDQLKGFPTTRVVVTVPELGDEDFLAMVREMGLKDVAYSVGWSAWLDIAPHGVNKGTALERVRRELGIAPADVLVVGDGRNDIEMLEWAVGGGGRGVAMGQAPEEVFEAANEATASVEDDGMAFVLSTVE